ncbi:MAG: hypothetical protein Q4D87_08075 [Actinomycetaceae bacterium]|nr:hypothetical protein [Actinomycetaceae bacterium]
MNKLENLNVEDQLVDAFERFHDWSVDNPRSSEACVLGAATFVWYAMPDVTKSSAVRFVAKTALLGGLGSYYYHLNDDDNKVQVALENCQKLWKDNLGHLPPAAQVAIGVSGAVTALKVNSVVERYILHRGERRKKQGKKFPHVRQALCLGAATGGLAYYLLRK